MDVLRLRSKLPVRLLAAALLVVPLGLAACSGDSDEAVAPANVTDFSERGPWDVATLDRVFVDTSRTTFPNGDFPGAPERVLQVRVFYPIAPGSDPSGEPAPAADGPFPLVGYAHGFTSGRGGAEPVGGHLVTHGYIVIAPDFPLSHGGAPGGPTTSDMANQPGDLAFVMRQLRQLDHPVADAIDTDRQGILGLSLGGATVVIGAFHPTLGLDFIDAAVGLAPASCFAGPDFYQRSVPTLLVAGTADELVPLDESPGRTFEFAPAPTTLVRLEGGTHVGMLGIGVPGATNSDLVVGCPAVLSEVDEDVDMGDFEPSATLFTEGVSGDVYRPDGCNVDTFCDHGFVQTMTAERQVLLTRTATVAHFEAHLRDRADARVFLEEAFGANESDVNVEIRR